ncbi:hypothetical protein MY1884_009717 [Beauveria asiatica]
MDQFQASDALLKYVYSGVIGDIKGLAVDYALMRTTDSTFTFSAALEPLDHLPEFLDRFTDGGFSTSYKVTVMHNPEIVYVVQLRFHGNVASMDAFMKFVHANSTPGVIPMPAVYSIPGEAEHQQSTGFGRQITRFEPGVLAERVYSDLPGPFTSVREWLKGRLRHAVSSLGRASGIDDYKDKYMVALQAFVDNKSDLIPQTVEECPIAALHVDMGLHNVLVAEGNHKEVKAIIDWELCASAPFLAAYPCIEMLFRRGAPNGFGPEYPHADELRSTFWDAIPEWKTCWESQGVRDFMEWFRFALFLRPEYCPKEKSMAEKCEFWAENKYNVES